MERGVADRRRSSIIGRKGIYKKLRVEMIWLHHNALVARHGEKWKTTKLIMRNY